jgi:hypothetical protein
MWLLLLEKEWLEWRNFALAIGIFVFNVKPLANDPLLHLC